jgi:hypothetical protein
LRRVIVRTLSRELILHTPSEEAFAALSYAGADPVMVGRTLVPIELPVEARGHAYRLRPPGRSPSEGSLDTILNGVFRLLGSWTSEESRDTPILHAAMVSFEGRRLAFLGDKGFGKTTLMLRLIEEGATVEGDEHVVIRSGGAVARPRRLHVKESSLALVPALADAIRASPFITDWTGSRVFALAPSFRERPWEIAERPIDHLVFAEPNFGGASRLSAISRDEAFARMIQTAFMPSDGIGRAAALLRTLSASARAWRLELGVLDQAVRHLREIADPV